MKCWQGNPIVCKWFCPRGPPSSGRELQGAFAREVSSFECLLETGTMVYTHNWCDPSFFTNLLFVQTKSTLSEKRVVVTILFLVKATQTRANLGLSDCLTVCLGNRLWVNDVDRICAPGILPREPPNFIVPCEVWVWWQHGANPYVKAWILRDGHFAWQPSSTQQQWPRRTEGSIRSIRQCIKECSNTQPHPLALCMSEHALKEPKQKHRADLPNLLRNYHKTLCPEKL